MQHICIAGPAGSGKGRLIKSLMALMNQAGYNPALVTAGPSLVERAKGKCGEAKQISKCLKMRAMVPDNIAMRVIHHEYNHRVHRGIHQVILDGCPRTPVQAREVMRRFRGNRHIIISVVASFERCLQNGLNRNRGIDDHPELLEEAIRVRYPRHEVPAILEFEELGAQKIEVVCPEYSVRADWDIADQAPWVLEQMRLGRVLKFPDLAVMKTQELSLAQA